MRQRHNVTKHALCLPYQKIKLKYWVAEELSKILIPVPLPPLQIPHGLC